jgi:hypothetical protein
MTLATQWLELKPKTPMKTAADMSELLMEVPGLVLDQDKAGRFLLADGARFEVEGYLTTGKGERIYLDEICVSGLSFPQCHTALKQSPDNRKGCLGFL